MKHKIQIGFVWSNKSRITALCGTTGAGAFLFLFLLNFPLEQSLWGQF
jgi:hypothetical protein